jgi:ribosomal protein S8
MNNFSIKTTNILKVNILHNKNTALVKYTKTNVAFLKSLLKQGLIQNFRTDRKKGLISVYFKFDQNLNSAINSLKNVSKTSQNLKLNSNNLHVSKTNFNVLFTNVKKQQNTSKLLDCLLIIK